jgi:AcrR family transcriptional regulator
MSPPSTDDGAEPRRRGRPRAKPDGDVDPGADPRAGIIEAASGLFAAKGVDAVTMAEISEAAGLQQSSIYYWFKSKPDILASILESVNRVPLAIVERELAAPGPVAERLHRLLREDVLALCGFPFDINEIHRLAARRPDAFAGYWDERRRLDQELERLIVEGVANGELRAVDAGLAARMLLAIDEATQNLLRIPEGGAPYEPDELAEHVATAGVRSLLADL